MASIPYLSSLTKGREPLTGSKRIIVFSALGFVVFILWAMLAKVDEVTSGQGKVIPSSKIQVIQSAEPATVQELLVRSIGVVALTETANSRQLTGRRLPICVRRRIRIHL